jgi:hypothetical protein
MLHAARIVGVGVGVACGMGCASPFSPASTILPPLKEMPKNALRLVMRSSPQGTTWLLFDPLRVYHVFLTLAKAAVMELDLLLCDEK